MPLSDIRTRFFDASGRKDFEANPSIADRFINAGLRLLDTWQQTPKSVARYQKDIAAGEFIIYLRYCRSIQEVWVMNGDGRRIVSKRTLHWIRKNFADNYADLDKGTPLYYAPAVIGLSPDHSYGSNIVKDPNFDKTTTWSPANGWTIVGGKARHSPKIDMALWQDTDIDNLADKLYNFTFTLSDCVAGSVTPRIGNTAGTARSANGTYSETILHDVSDNKNLIVNFKPSLDFDGAITNISIYSVLVSAYDWQDLKFGDHFGHRGIIFMPPADEPYTMTVFAYFYSDPLVNPEDENFWSKEFPDTLVKAACYELETYYRNTEGAKDYLSALQLALRGIDYDAVEEELAEIQNQTWGYRDNG